MKGIGVKGECYLCVKEREREREMLAFVSLTPQSIKKCMRKQHIERKNMCLKYK